MTAQLSVPVIDVLFAHILAIGGEIIARWCMDVATANKEQDITQAAIRWRRNHISAAPGHVPRGTIPLLAPVCL